MSGPTTPVLVVGFNRPELLKLTLRAISACRIDRILVALDGPRAGRQADIEKVAECQSVVESLELAVPIETRFRSTNLGVRRAVVDAVDWAVSKYGRVIVIEDDAVPSQAAFDFAITMLDRYQNDSSIGHISLYNVVPEDVIQDPASAYRISRFPESYAWATWERAWRHYDDELRWGRAVSLSGLRDITGSFSGAIKWRMNFRDAAAERLDTWAYRWIASLWEQRMRCISPNANLVSYIGQEGGTHTKRRQRWLEQPTVEMPAIQNHYALLNCDADEWLAHDVFQETVRGVMEGVAVSVLLHLRSKYRPRR